MALAKESDGKVRRKPTSMLANRKKEKIMKSLKHISLAAALTCCVASPAQAALLGPLGGSGLNGEYASFGDSPFNGLSFSYFFLENFEDGLLNTPGVTASAGQILAPSSITDSVDADDGAVDGSGAGGYDWYYGAANSDTFVFSFAAGVLGHLPTHAGLVYTDGLGDAIFEAFGPSGISLGSIGPVYLEDGFYGGLTRDDRFFGAINPGGISAIRIKSASIEVDHLQYGNIAAVPEPATLTLFSLGLVGLAAARRFSTNQGQGKSSALPTITA
jgi:hypothetical protein